MVLTDGSGLLTAIRHSVLRDPVAAAQQSPRANPANLKAIQDELVRWADANEPAPDEVNALQLLLRRLGDLRSRSTSCFDSTNVLAAMLTGVAPSLSTAPLHYAMWFLVEASLQHGRTNAFDRTDELVRQARSGDFLLSEQDLPGGSGAPAIPGWARKSTLRLGRKYSAGFSQAPWEGVMRCLQMDDAETERMREMYLTCLQHPSPTACG
ncbi:MULTISPECIES: hypothetical protein [unclassified Variovorax]|uniref:hypothetical protein n=1 Tax=unclassified Variovorax TaxID=663243 RepID=UPI0013A591EF|nr:MULTISPECIES: hypothetical protein [unclassified Variovorax]